MRRFTPQWRAVATLSSVAPAFIDGETASYLAGRGSDGEARCLDGLDRRAEMAHGTQGERRDVFGADPIGRLDRRQQTQQAHMHLAAMVERKQLQLEIRLRALLGPGARPGDGRDGLVG